MPGSGRGRDASDRITKQEATMSVMRWFVAVTASVLIAVISGCERPGARKLFYINSYHPGCASSDAVMEGIYEVVGASTARLDVFFMDTKRFPESDAIAAKVQEVMEVIKRLQPEVIIVSDDSAVKYVVSEHFKQGPIPCVFCGVDWTCEPYGLPTDNVTGMLEVWPVRETVEALRPYYPNMKRVMVLSGNTVSGQKNEAMLATIFAEVGLNATCASVDTYDEWRMHFLKANAESDVIFLAAGGAIKDWDSEDAQAFVRKHTQAPVLTCDDSLMKYAVFGVTKVAQEQGQWAAHTALRIVRGKSPAQIPVAQNQQTIAYVNETLADKIGFKPEAALLERCHRMK
jgi:ABC-type uncharacterized transport system substrate-binding protein